MKSTKSCEVLPEMITVTFENPDHVYKPGLPYTGTVTGAPLSLWGSPAPAAPSPALPTPRPALPWLQPQTAASPLPSRTDPAEGHRWLRAAPEAGPAPGQEPGTKEDTKLPDRQLGESLLPAGHLRLEWHSLLAGKCPTRVPPSGVPELLPAVGWGLGAAPATPRGLLDGFTP